MGAAEILDIRSFCLMARRASVIIHGLLIHRHANGIGTIILRASFLYNMAHLGQIMPRMVPDVTCDVENLSDFS